MIRNSSRGAYRGAPEQSWLTPVAWRSSSPRIPIASTHSDFQTNLVQVATLSINCSAEFLDSIGENTERVSALILHGFAQFALQLVEFTRILRELVIDGIWPVSKRYSY